MLDDPYAARLAGVRADKLFDEPHLGTEFAATVRAAVIDELVQRAILEHHLHAVVTLWAGFDTRPFRLDLPRDLRWIELDRESVFAYKELRLAHATPACQVERVGVDLAKSDERHALLQRAASGVARGLVFIEDGAGPAASAALQEIGTRMPPGLRWWIVDAPVPSNQASPQSGSVDSDFVEALCGDRWHIADRRPLEHEARRLAPDRLHSLGTHLGRPVNGDLGDVWILRRLT